MGKDANKAYFSKIDKYQPSDLPTLLDANL